MTDIFILIFLLYIYLTSVPIYISKLYERTNHASIRRNTLPATGIPNAFKIKGWTITTVRSPILSSAEIDDATDKLKIPMPEMVFGNNYLELSYSPGSVTDATEPSLNENKDVQSENVQWSLRFDTYGALDRVDKTGERLEGGLYKSRIPKVATVYRAHSQRMP